MLTASDIMREISKNNDEGFAILKEAVSMKKSIISKSITTTLLISMLSGTYVPASTVAPSLEETLLSGVASFQTNIDISKNNLSPNEALNKAITIFDAAPEAWAVNEKVSIQTQGNKAKAVIIKYDYSKDEVLAMQMYIDGIVKKAVAVANTFQTDYDKAKAVYDYLIDNYDYDWSLTKTKEYEMFKTGEGVCTAYSLAYKDIMQELGIPCLTVSSSEIAHMWNVVQIDGNWYNVDVSWGDIYTAEDESFRYSNFMKSDYYFELLGHTGGVTENNVKCTSLKYDY